MKIFLVLALVTAAAVLPGCVVRGRSGNSVAVGPAVQSCSHSDECGHYNHKGKWHHSQGHRHGHNCGHSYNGGIWIVLD
ncbi:MAG TPA: hypothetical protein VJS20_08015 [Gemmatimonadales bacterium]|nr:hypothetical protein [Gemmatimonadales bacterium]